MLFCIIISKGHANIIVEVRYKSRMENRIGTITSFIRSQSFLPLSNDFETKSNSNN